MHVSRRRGVKLRGEVPEGAVLGARGRKASPPDKEKPFFVQPATEEDFSDWAGSFRDDSRSGTGRPGECSQHPPDLEYPN